MTATLRRHHVAVQRDAVYRFALVLTDYSACLAEASCRGMAPLFDSDIEGEKRGHREERLRFAKRVCGCCPVREECRRVAMRLDKPTGIWAGVDRERRAGRPRNDGAEEEEEEEEAMSW